MTADVELLPLPERVEVDKHLPTGVRIYAYDANTLKNYARANVAHAIAPLQAEIDALRTRLEDTVRDSTNKIEALRAEVAEWKRVATAQAELHDEAEARAERLAEALRGVLPFVVSDVLEHCDGNKCREQWCAGCMGDEYAAEQVEMARAAAQEARALLRDQEEGK